MQGHVYYDKKSKRWYIQIYWQGKKYAFYRESIEGKKFFSKEDAEYTLNKIRAEIENKSFNPNHWKVSSPMYVRTYAMDWRDCINVIPKTLQGYRGDVTNWITPYFGDKDIRGIRHNDLVKFYKSIDRGDKRRCNILNTLKTMMRYAWKNEDIPKVPPFPELSYNLPKIEYIELEQQESILSYIPEHHRPIFKFMMEYGCRVGEARALMKDCISDSEVTIKRTMSDEKVRESTKSGKERVYRITPYFKEVLSSMAPTLSQFVFPRADGKPYRSKDVNKIWKQACEKASISIKLYNGTRHSLGCQLLDLGNDIYAVSQQLGHKKIESAKRYAERSSKKLEEILISRRVVKFKKEQNHQ